MGVQVPLTAPNIAIATGVALSLPTKERGSDTLQSLQTMQYIPGDSNVKTHLKGGPKGNCTKQIVVR